MSVIDELREEVTTIATTRGLPDSRAFGYWFLETIEDLSEEEAEQTIVDGPWDGGRDAVRLDEDQSQLDIYQFKYSDSRDYSLGAFSDLQRAVQAEKDQLARVDSVRLVVVTLASADTEFRNRAKRTRQNIKAWLTRNNFINYKAEIEVIDLIKFTQIWERLHGIQATIHFRGSPVESQSGLLGLADASFAREADQEELFAFNVRQFLGVRKGSVNADIKETLEDQEARDEFWTLNNGIVCLCTDYKAQASNEYAFENLTVVNGAQTISSITRYLEDNPAVTEPIWVVAKLLKVGEEDIDRARKLTKTSNTQNPTSNKDLRASDISHRRIKDWFSRHSDVQYLFRRGDRPESGGSVVQMKDLAQAYIAFWDKKPHISFAQVGKIFSDDELYSSPFPSDEIAELRQNGDAEEIRTFLERRLLAHNLLQKIRAYLRNNVQDKTHRSLAYHILWLYSKLFEEMRRDSEVYLLHERHAQAVENTIETISDNISDFFAQSDVAFPRVLKGTQAVEMLTEKALSNNWIRRTRTALQEVLAQP